MNRNYGTVTPIFCHKREQAPGHSRPAGRATVTPIRKLNPVAVLQAYHLHGERFGSLSESEHDAYRVEMKQFKVRLFQAASMLDPTDNTVAASILRQWAKLQRQSQQNQPDNVALQNIVDALVLEMKLKKYVGQLHEPADIMINKVGSNE